MICLLYLAGLLALVPGGGEQPSVTETTRLAFTARVERIEILPGRVVPAGVIADHPDPRWLLRLRVLRVESAVVDSTCPERIVYAIHSPTKTFQRPASAVGGKVFRFVEHRSVDAAGRRQGARLEVKAARLFDTRSGWRRLRWNMSTQEVRDALTEMRIAFEVDEAIGMFPTSPARQGASGGAPDGFVEKSYIYINFMVDGGRAGAELEGWRLRSVSVQSPPLATKVQVEARLAALRQAMGKPDRTGPPSDEPGALRYAWSNAENSLGVHTVRTAEGWLVSERYQRVPFDKL